MSRPGLAVQHGAATRAARPAGGTEVPDRRALLSRVHRRLVGTGGLPEGDTPGRDLEIRARLAELLRDEAPLLRAGAFAQLLTELTHEVSGLGPLEPLLVDPSVTEIMVNGPGQAFVERGGRLESVRLDLDADAIVRLVERVVAPLGLRLDRSSPLVDARLSDGSRLHAVIPPLALDGPCVTIRRFGTRDLALSAFGVAGGCADLLGWAVAAGWNVLVSGGTSTGKTTLLNALSAAVPDAERIVTIEETAELRLRQPHVVRLEARPPNAEGAGGTSVRELVRAALRMRPDRIVVGEVRGGEALDMLQALNTGHDGSLSTVHANTAGDALARLETLVLMAGLGLPIEAVRAQIATAVDAVVQVGRAGDGIRRVVTVGEVVRGAADPYGPPAVRPLFERRAPGELVAVGEPSRAARRAGGPPPGRPGGAR